MPADSQQTASKTKPGRKSWHKNEGMGAGTDFSHRCLKTMGVAGIPMAEKPWHKNLGKQLLAKMAGHHGTKKLGKNLAGKILANNPDSKNHGTKNLGIEKSLQNSWQEKSWHKQIGNKSWHVTAWVFIRCGHAANIIFRACRPTLLKQAFFCYALPVYRAGCIPCGPVLNTVRAASQTGQC